MKVNRLGWVLGIVILMQLGGGTVVEARSLAAYHLAKISCGALCFTVGTALAPITAGISEVIGAVASIYCGDFADAVVPEEDSDKRKKKEKRARVR